MRHLILPAAALLLAWPLSACRPASSNVPDGGVLCSTDQDCQAALDAGNCGPEGVCVICQTSADCVGSESCSAGTCVAGSGSGSGGSTTGGSTGGNGTGGGSTGLPPGQCVTSCDCSSSSKGPACISGNCGPKPSSCSRANDCPCNELCSAGNCEPKCAKSSDCKDPLPVCYLPQGQCGPCTSSSQCSDGGVCVNQICTSAPDGGCSPQHCCSSGDCLSSAPVCNPATNQCGPCTSSLQCSTGYACSNGSCTAFSGDAGCLASGCAVGKVCQGNVCVTASCNPPCGAPATCGPNNSCVCPTNCNNICPSGQTCNMTSCQCGVGSGGSIGGSIGGFPSSGGLGGSNGSIPSTCNTSTCTGCPSGQNCMCDDGNPCSSSDVWCLLGALSIPGVCQ